MDNDLPSNSYSLARIGEAHHRCQNTLQIIKSVSRSMIRNSKGAEAKEALSYICELVHVLGKLHMLVDTFGETVEFSEHLRQCAIHWQRICNGQIRVVVDAPDALTLASSEATNASLIVHELVLNAVKHAFPDGRHGTIQISCLLTSEKGVIVTVEDDGVGNNDPFREDTNGHRDDVHGRTLIGDFTEALGGRILKKERDGGGHSVSVCWSA